MGLASVCHEAPCAGGCPHESEVAQQDGTTPNPPVVSAAIDSTPLTGVDPQLVGLVTAQRVFDPAPPPDPLFSRLLI